MPTLEEQINEVQDKIEGLKDKITGVEALITNYPARVTELDKQLTELNRQLTLLQEKENLLLKERVAAQPQAVLTETTIHLSVDGKEQVDYMPFKPRVDLKSVADKLEIDIQEYAIEASSTTAPKYQPVKILSPPIDPTQAVWIKAKKRRGPHWIVKAFFP